MASGTNENTFSVGDYVTYTTHVAGSIHRGAGHIEHVELVDDENADGQILRMGLDGRGFRLVIDTRFDVIHPAVKLPQSSIKDVVPEESDRHSAGREAWAGTGFFYRMD
jgi:hypothetical protein